MVTLIEIEMLAKYCTHHRNDRFDRNGKSNFYKVWALFRKMNPDRKLTLKKLYLTEMAVTIEIANMIGIVTLPKR